MNDELKYATIKLTSALDKLKEGSNAAKKELEKDGVIQRFEFTFELFWKTIKIFLRDNGVDARTPKECLKEAFKIGWIGDEEIFLNMLEDRNNTSHVYDRESAEAIFERIRDDYVAVFAKTLKKLKAIS